MICVILSFGISPMVPIIHISLLNLTKRPEISQRFMYFSFIFYLFIWGLSSLYIHQQKVFSFSDFMGGFWTLIFICLAYIEAFSMICRGFSLQILTDIYLNGSQTKDQLILNYAEGKGVDWMIRKRIKTMENLNLIIVSHDGLSFGSNISRIIAIFSLYFKRLLKLGEGGIWKVLFLKLASGLFHSCYFY